MRKNAQDYCDGKKRNRINSPDIPLQLIGLQKETMKTRFKLENFLLDNQTTLIHGAHECAMFADLPKYFSVPLAEMKAPGMISFKSESKFTVYASYTHSKPSEEELIATNVRSKVFKLAHIKRGG